MLKTCVNLHYKTYFCPTVSLSGSDGNIARCGCPFRPTQPAPVAKDKITPEKIMILLNKESAHACIVQFFNPASDETKL